MESKHSEIIPQLAIRLNTSTGFEQRYFENLKDADEGKKAYEKTEQEYQKYFGRRRYTSYRSFREVMNRRYRKRKA